jgi:hypothetical protein
VPVTMIMPSAYPVEIGSANEKGPGVNPTPSHATVEDYGIAAMNCGWNWICATAEPDALTK